jgi:hypothetical protein
VLSGVALARRGERPTPLPTRQERPVAFALNVDAVHQHGAEGHTPIEINGGTNPELIPDDYAYSHFLAATAISSKHTDKQKSFIRRRIAEIGLSDGDRQFYEDTLVQLRLRDELDRIKTSELSVATAAKSKSSQAIATLTNLRFEKRNLMDYAKDRVTIGMTPQGVAKLQAYIDSTVKRQIRIVRVEMVP